MEDNLLHFMAAVVAFLIGQLAINIGVLRGLNTRLTRVETHITHLLQRYGVHEESEE